MTGSWWQRLLLCSALLGASAWPALSLAQGGAAPAVPSLRQWVLETGDNEASPFAIIDKRQAHLWLFTAAGKPLGDTPVLLGLARGDASVAGIGERTMEQIRPQERVTPAGRFLAEAGRNADGEDIFWIDYDAAVSMHRVRANKASEQRLQRLASATAADNRITYGCINVPAKFYDDYIRRAFSGQQGVVYVLPESLPARQLFTPARVASRSP